MYDLITEEQKDKIPFVKTLDEMQKVVLGEKVYIYGAGIIGSRVVAYLKKKKMGKNLYGIVVSDKRDNPDSILEIPVLEIDQCLEFKDCATILICVVEEKQDEIVNMLLNRRFQSIYCLKYSFYLELKNEVPNINELLPVEKYEEGLKYWYKKQTGKELNLVNPQTYNEKIQWVKLFGITPLMTKLSDKYMVREWIADQIGSEYLVKLLGVWDGFENINFDELPEKFVLKCTHGSGFNEIVKNKAELDIKEVAHKFDVWMRTNLAFQEGLELQYRDIVPRIIAEEYMENEKGDLFDYKFWCFEGKVEFIMFLSERQNGLKMNNFDRDWNLLPFTYDYEQSTREIEKPAKLIQMIEIAETLAKGFHHVRVDLYLLNNGDIKFGEMTFTSCSGRCRWSNEEIDYELGQLMVLDKEIK